VKLAHIRVPGPPTAKGRHRDGFNFKTGRRVKYTPAKTVAFEHLVGLHARRAYWGNPTEAPIAIAVIQLYAPPKSWSKKKTHAALSNFIPHKITPDADNVMKAVKDGLNRIIYCDDSQLTLTFGFKRYSRTEETIILIYDATEVEPVFTSLTDEVRALLLERADA
jgi:Holliday junction resolvase RusA-like endonuclease